MTDAVSQPLKLTINPLPDTPPAAASAAANAAPGFWSGDSPSFQDVLDTVNPLEHIPIVSTIYHAIAGDTPSPGSKIVGGALFGGPFGLLAALFDSVVQSATGSDVSGNVMAALTGNPIPALHNGEGKETELAMNNPPDHFSANQRAYYNAYVQTQNLLS